MTAAAGYRASEAQWKADMAARWPNTVKLVANPLLHEHVQQRSAGQITLPDGTARLSPARRRRSQPAAVKASDTSPIGS